MSSSQDFDSNVPLVTRSVRQPIRCVETGETYKSITSAGTNMGLPEGSISKHLQGKQPHVQGYTFERVAKYVPEPHRDVYGSEIQVGTKLIVAVGAKGSGAIVTVLALTYWNNKPSLQVQWHNGKIGYWRDISNTTLVCPPTFGEASESDGWE